MLASGLRAPNFSLPDQNNILHSLTDYRGKYILLYFYPKDMTPGCTKEACALRDSYEEIKKLNAVVLGVSADSPARHAAFAKTHKLPFALLSDESKEMLTLYGAWGLKKMMGREYWGIFRISYLIDPEGIIVKAYDKVKPELHAGQVLRDLKVLR